MALYKEDIIDIELESGSIHRSWMNHAIGLGDVKANRFGVRIFRNGEAVNIGSGTCQGFFMRPDGTNLQIQGSTYTGVDGNLAWVQLPQDAYAFQGQFCLAIKLIGGGITGTMRIIDGMVDNTGTTGAVSPTSTVPTSQEIIAAYNNAVAVIDNSVRHDIDQSLTAAQKTRARTNIEAASQEDLEAEAAIREEKDTSLRGALRFWNFARFTGRITWDTVNKTLTVGSGYVIYPGGYKHPTSNKSVSYTNFNNLSALIYKDDNTLAVAPFNSLVPGYALAWFEEDKVYCPYGYSNIYMDGNPVTTANIFDGFVSFIDAVDAKVDAVNDEIEGINDKLDAFFPETTVYNENNTPRSNATSDNIWIPKELTIPANVIVTTIDVYVTNDTQKTFSISFWNSETGEKYADKTYTLTPSQNVVSIPINVQTTSPTKIGFYSASAFATVTGKNGSNLLYVEPSATSILNASTLAKWALNATVKAIVINQDNTRVLSQEIHVGDGLAFTEIQQAIESVIGDYATIIVHPKSTPYGRFSLMRSLGGSYPWSGLTSVKHISIIGVDKTKCIVQSNTGNYDTPPAEIATNGIIKNLTFIATHTASDGTETTGSYAVHVDNRPADTNGMKLVFENCDFISYQTAAVGLGLYRNQDILFDHCNFKSYTDSTWKPNENYDSAYMCAIGAYFMHTTMGRAGGNMFIRFRGCFFYHEGGSYAMRIADADEVQTALLEAIDNTLWVADTQTPGYYTTNNPIMQMPYNHGNNASELNV